MKNWQGFNQGIWQDKIDVRDFIQKNYTPYDGDEAFLTDPHAELLRTCDTYREIYFSQFPEERARYSSVSAGNIMKEVTV